MAKKKKEKVIDLKPTSITSEELTSIQELINALSRVQTEVGRLESRKHGLLHQIGMLQDKIAETQKELEKTYGKVDINITDGTISYQDDVKADKKD